MTSEATPPPLATALAEFGRYEVILLAVTQLGYLPVTSSLVATQFFEPTKEFCAAVRFNESGQNDTVDVEKLALENGEFRSLWMHWGRACKDEEDTVLLSFLSFALMLGGVPGAFLAGRAADRHGRRTVVILSQFLLALGNLAALPAGELGWPAIALVFMVIGAAAGAYMVTNLVLLVEQLQTGEGRLVAVCLNGWAWSMCGTAAVGFLTTEWRRYHLCTATLAALFAVLLYWWPVESARWLRQRGREIDAQRAEKLAARRGASPQKSTGSVEYRAQMTPAISVVTGERMNSMQSSTPSTEVRTYGYADVWRNRSIRKRLICLVYSFTVSSVTSFGFYFNVDSLEGDRFANMAAMGAGKALLGLLPLALSPCVRRRRPLFLASAGGAFILVTSIIIIWHIAPVTTAYGWLAVATLLSAGVMDPAWKLNHLWSTELFPTVVRNMARGACNVGGRIGSLVAPVLIASRYWHPLVPYTVFAFLLAGQWMAVYVWLPETSGRQLRDRLEEEEEDEHETTEELESVRTEDNAAGATQDEKEDRSELILSVQN